MIPFAKTQGFSLARYTRPWNKEVAAFTERWAARGIEVPTAPPPLDQRPDYDAPGDAALVGERRRYAGWTTEQLIELMLRFLNSLQPGQRPNKDEFDAWSSTRPVEPWSDKLVRDIGFAEIRTEAQRRRRDRRDGRDTGET